MLATKVMKPHKASPSVATAQPYNAMYVAVFDIGYVPTKTKAKLSFEAHSIFCQIDHTCYCS